MKFWTLSYLEEHFLGKFTNYRKFLAINRNQIIYSHLTYVSCRRSSTNEPNGSIVAVRSLAEISKFLIIIRNPALPVELHREECLPGILSFFVTSFYCKRNHQLKQRSSTACKVILTIVIIHSSTRCKPILLMSFQSMKLRPRKFFRRVMVRLLPGLSLQHPRLE